MMSVGIFNLSFSAIKGTISLSFHSKITQVLGTGEKNKVRLKVLLIQY